MIPVSKNLPRSLLWLALPVGWLWFRLIDHLRIEWTVNEQYAYGWAVPFLCAYLLWRRFQNAEMLKAETLTSGSFSFLAFQVFSFSLLAAFLLTRWIEAANPDWRLVSWALAIEVIAFTLLLAAAAFGGAVARRVAFPLVFFLVAVPWPTMVEQPLIQVLTRGIVAVTVELLNAFGIAAVPHGNVIETAGGLVDIDEACSGIRSLQAVLMLALFFGELRRFSPGRRVGLTLVAFALAAFFNLIRTFTLSLVAARRGPAAVASWHDPAGIAILVGCFIGVWAVATWLARSPVRRGSVEPAHRPPPTDALVPLVPLSRLLPVALAGLLLVGELAVHFWYAAAAPAPGSNWTAAFPTNQPDFKAADIPPAAEKILRFNEGRSGTWQNPDGTRWQMIYLRWSPGRSAAALARNHTPEICLPAAGRKLRGVAEVPPVPAGGLNLAFRSFATGSEGRPLFVFYTLWEDGASAQHATAVELTWRVRLGAVLERRRNPGQRVLELAVWGARDEAHAVELLRAELPRLISAAPAK